MNLHRTKAIARTIDSNPGLLLRLLWYISSKRQGGINQAVAQILLFAAWLLLTEPDGQAPRRRRRQRRQATALRWREPAQPSRGNYFSALDG